MGPVKYKKTKTALRTGKKKIAGAKGGREQAKTKTCKDEAENQVSKSASDASDRGGMQTRDGGRKHNTTGRWRTKGKKEGMERRKKGGIARKKTNRKRPRIGGRRKKGKEYRKNGYHC